METERHVLLQCPFASRVWDLVPALYKPDPTTINSPENLLQACRRMVNLPPSGLNEAALYPWILWYLWIARNRLVFENREGSEQELVTLALKEARIWQTAQREKGRLQTPQKKGSQAPPTCHRDIENQCFVDAAWNADTSGGGFGCIFKDTTGRTLQHFSSNRSNVSSALVAEALALKAGLKAARSLGLRKLAIRSDSKSLIMGINAKEKIVEAQEVLFDITQLCTCFTAVSFDFIYRGLNEDADALAKAALQSLSNSV